MESTDNVKLPTSPLLEVKDLTCSFGGVLAVDGASFTVAKGCVTGLIGPNGAGKSSVVNAIAGAVKPNAGRVVFRGEEIQDLQPHQVATRGLTRIYQQSTEFGAMTVLENLLAASKEFTGSAFLVSVRGKRAWRELEERAILRARELLKRFDLGDKESDFAKSLSGGQKRLLEFARALMTEPELLILDEPLAGVNPALAQRIASEMEILRDSGLTILLIEHDLPLVERICSEVVVMANGRVISTGTMDHIRNQREVVDAYLSR
jgi:branched-chain amino acid transport system ATP-binding protein